MVAEWLRASVSTWSRDSLKGPEFDSGLEYLNGRNYMVANPPAIMGAIIGTSEICDQNGDTE